MYLFPIETRTSRINGKGVFALQKILKGEIVWKYDSGHDITISTDKLGKLDESEQEDLNRIAYLSASSKLYVYPPENDPARFTNHSTNNNLTVLIDKKVSPEPYFVANRDIEIGEEITNNYFEFDETLKKNRSEWGNANSFL